MSDSIIIVLIWCGTILLMCGGIGVVIYWAQTDAFAKTRVKNKIEESQVWADERQRLEAPRDVTKK